MQKWLYNVEIEFFYCFLTNIIFFFLTLTTQLNSADFYSLNIQSKLKKVKFSVSTFYIISVSQFFLS